MRLAQLPYNPDKMKAKEHYDNHLSQFYAWMTGPFDDAQQVQERFLRKHNIVSATKSPALDLGAGHGLQSVSLARLGFDVVAVDFNARLLEELAANKGDLDIKCIQADLLQYFKDNAAQAEIILCMGDTLTHLERIQQVEELILEITNHLLPNGKVVLSFRDLTPELFGEQRFIPVRSDNTKILTCFLEYFPDHVMVNDIFQENIEGKWTQKISCYPKLRFNQTYIESLLSKQGIEVVASETINRMIYLVARKTNAPK